MRIFKYLAFVLAVLTLSACQTVPIHTAAKRTFADQVGKDKGVVRVIGFHVPKDEPGATFFLVLAAAGGADINYPIYTSVFDVTDKTRYLGTLQVSVPMNSWLEYDVPTGKRIFMLTLAGRSSILAQSLGISHTDFIEVDVKPGSVSHVVMSRYGFSRYPYFGEIEIADKHREYCLKLAGARNEREKVVEQYMADNGINQYARDFKYFCLMLSDPKFIQEPNDEARKQFSEQRSQIESLRNETYKKWKTESEKRTPYDLMRVYQPSNQEL